MPFFCCFLVNSVCVYNGENTAVLPQVPITGSPVKKMLQTHTHQGGASPQATGGNNPVRKKEPGQNVFVMC